MVNVGNEKSGMVKKAKNRDKRRMEAFVQAKRQRMEETSSAAASSGQIGDVPAPVWIRFTSPKHNGTFYYSEADFQSTCTLPDGASVRDATQCEQNFLQHIENPVTVPTEIRWVYRSYGVAGQNTGYWYSPELGRTRTTEPY